jgi:voltage-gated potassium channel
MPQVTRAERWLDSELARAATPRGAAIIIAVVTTSITVGAGLLMTIIDRKEFPTIGDGLWWAVQTVTTVGYGDHVPETAVGHLVAAVVMLLGIGFVTVITASITSSFVARSQGKQQLLERDSPPTSEQLQMIDTRLERIETALSARDL